MRSDPDPVDLAPNGRIDASADAADPDDRGEGPPPDSPHAVVAPEHPILVRVAFMIPQLLYVWQLPIQLFQYTLVASTTML